MNTDTLRAPTTKNSFPLQTKKFLITVVTNPTVLAQRPAKYVDLLFGTNQSNNASATLSNFQFEGGTVRDHYVDSGSRGSFGSSFTMQCRPQSPAPQIIGLMGTKLTQFSFDLEISTDCSTNDWFTLWLIDQSGHYFPSTAEGRPGLFASVSWNTAGQFTPAGYSGNGLIDNQTDAGFEGSSIPA